MCSVICCLPLHLKVVNFILMTCMEGLPRLPCVLAFLAIEPLHIEFISRAALAGLLPLGSQLFLQRGNPWQNLPRRIPKFWRVWAQVESYKKRKWEKTRENEKRKGGNLDSTNFEQVKNSHCRSNTNIEITNSLILIGNFLPICPYQ